MKNKKVSNKERVRALLNEAGHSLSIEKVSHLTGLTKTQVRNTANYFDSDIVPVGNGKIDLLTRIYKGRGLRVTPRQEDVQAGIVSSDELSVYLWPIGGIKKITIFSETGEKFSLKNPFTVSSFNGWYRATNFQGGDDIIFRCRNLGNREFEIFHLPFKERDEEEIAHKNSRLGEEIYRILKYSINKSDHIYFLARKYLLKNFYLNEILPDQLPRALSKNKYLIIFKKNIMGQGFLNVGIKKYFYHHKGKYYPVSILEDEVWGKYGYCMECESSMVWDEKRGWSPTEEDEYFDIFLDDNFFKKK